MMRRNVVWIVVAGVVLLLTGSSVWPHAATAGDRYRAGDSDVPERPVALVLGAGVRDDGLPSRMLANRLDAAQQLYSGGRVRAVLVSGDNSTEQYNETDTMRDYLIDAGVDPLHVVGDHAGFRTWDSCVRAREVFGVEEAIVVTQAFHLPRAVVLCRAAGIDVVGVGDPSFADRGVGTVYGYLREVIAAPLALIDAVLTPSPQFLGPYEDGIDDALTVNS